MSESDGPVDEPEGVRGEGRGDGGLGAEGTPETEEEIEGDGLGVVDGEGSPFLIVDVEERQSRERIRELRQGEGPLAETIYQVLEELHDEGQLADEVQPVVFIVREKPPIRRRDS
jgi:hypothetical protein